MSENTPPADSPRPADADPGNGPKITLETPGVRELVEAEKTAVQRKNEELIGEKRKAMADLEALQAQWKGLEPEKVRTLMKRFEQDEDAQMISEGKIDEVVAKRLEAKAAPLAQKIGELESLVGEKDKALQDRDQRIEDMVFDRVIFDAAADEKLGIQLTAIPDIKARARQVFTKLDEDLNPVSTEYGSNGSPLKGVEGMREWMDKHLRKKAPHCFKPSKGGGAVGSTGGGVSEKNPFAKETFDFNEATRLWKEDPEGAKRLKAEAERAST